MVPARRVPAVPRIHSDAGHGCMRSTCRRFIHTYGGMVFPPRKGHKKRTPDISGVLFYFCGPGQESIRRCPSPHDGSAGLSAFAKDVRGLPALSESRPTWRPRPHKTLGYGTTCRTPASPRCPAGRDGRYGPRCWPRRACRRRSRGRPPAADRPPCP